MEQKTIPAKKLKEYIFQNIRVEAYPDKLQWYLPFDFGYASSEPLCLTWTAKGELCDNGRAIEELKKRLGDITPYMPAIEKIISRSGNMELVGGRRLVTKHFQTISHNGSLSSDYIGAFTQLLHAITLISIVDSVTIIEQ